MHILHLTPYYAPAYAFGGVTRAVEGLARAQAAHGHQVTVLTTDAGDQTSRLAAPQDEVRDGVRVVRVRNLSVSLRGRFNLSTPFQMQTAARRLTADAEVVHAHEFRTVENWFVLPLAARLGKRIIVSPHGTLDLSTGRGGLKALWDALITPTLAPLPAAVIGLTAHEAEQARTLWMRWIGARATKIAFPVVPNGVDAAAFAHLSGGETFRERCGLGAAVVCLYMGRLHPRKGVVTLAQAFLRLAFPDCRLVIAGADDGAGAVLKALAAASDGRIVLTGFLDGAERLEALAAADLFALPAVGEGLPIAALEALAAGVPALLSPGCHLPEAGAAGAALIVEPTEAALTDGLRRLLSDPALRARMGAAGQRLVQERFTWDAAVTALDAVYDPTAGQPL